MKASSASKHVGIHHKNIHLTSYPKQSDGEPTQAIEFMLRNMLSHLMDHILVAPDSSAVIYIYDKQRHPIEIGHARGPMKSFMETNLLRPKGTTYDLIQTKEPIFVADIKEWPSNRAKLREEEIIDYNIVSAARIPLLVNNGEQKTLVGTMGINSPTPYAFNEEQRNSILDFAQQAAVLIQHVQMHRQEQRAIQAINDSVVNGRIEDVVHVATKTVVELTGATYSTVMAACEKETCLESIGKYHSDALFQAEKFMLYLDQKSISTYVFKRGIPHYARDVSTDPHHYQQPDWDQHTRSNYTVPLIIHKKLIGTFHVASDRLDGIPVQYQTLISNLAPYIATALHNTTLHERNQVLITESAQKQKVLDAVAKLQQSISDLLPLNDQFTQIREVLESLAFDVDGLFVALYDKETNVLRFPKVREHGKVVHDDDPRKQEGGRYGPRILGSQACMIEWVIQNKCSLLIPDMKAWPERQNIAPMESDDVTCCLVVPMFRAGQIEGVIGLRGYRGHGLFTKYHQEVLELVANHIAITIQNSSVYTEEEQYRKSIYKFHEGIANALPVAEQLRQIQNELQQLSIDTSSLFIATYNEVTKVIEFPKVYHQGRRIPANEKIKNGRYAPRRLGEQRRLIDWVIHNRSGTLLVPDFSRWVHRDEIDLVAVADLKCFLMTPMYREGQLIGIIGLRGYETTDMFDENHEKLLDESAKYISVILDNAHKYEGINNNLQQRLKEAQALTRFQEMVGNVEPVQEEIKDIFNEAYETLTQVGIDASNMYIALYRAETNTITFEIVYEHGQPVVLDDAENEDLYKSRHLDERPSLVRWVIKHGEPLLINSSKKFEELQSAGEIDYLPTQSKSWLGVPMQSHKQLFGVIVLRSFETESAFQQSHREFLTSIASYSAIALENSQLFESKQRQTRQAEALARASRGIARAGLDLSVALDVILSQAIEVTNAHLGTLRLTKDNNLELIASHTEIDSEKELVIFPSTIEQTSNHLESQAIEGNLYKIVPDVRQDYTIKALHPLTKSAIAVVIRTGGNENDRTPIGTLYLEHPHLSGFSEADCIIDLANMAAVAIQNAQNEKKLAQSRDYQLASNAVAWLGLFGADWQHTINQKTFSIETYVAGLRRQIRRLGLGTDKNQQIQGVLDEIVAVVADIRDVKFTSQVPQNVPKELKGQTELEVELPLTSGSTAIADEVQDMVERWCRHRSDVKRDYMFDCGDVEAPIAPQWLKVALEKLVNNALKAMPDGGTLTTEAYVRHKQIHIAISDTGKGIPEDVQAYFLKQAIPKNISQTGTGMGSLIARFIALSHGGDLALVHSKPDEGAKLLMTLPLDSDVMHNSAEIT